ncbi:putative protein NDR1 [Helianthus debilis subsp. tardiflorus]
MAVDIACCQGCCKLIITIISFVVLFFVYIAMVLPSIHVEEFYVPALNSTGNLTTINNTIYINLKLKNRNHVTGLYYIDPLFVNLSFIPKEKNTSIQLAELALHGFYQGKGKAKHLKGLLMTRGLPSVSNGTSNGTQGLPPPAGSFRLDFFGKVRYKVQGFHQRHSMLLEANVEVDEKTGLKVEDKAIRLVKSGAWDETRDMFFTVFMLFGVCFI